VAHFNDVKGKMVEVSPVIQAQINSSISLDNEDDDGCTMVVKGMHHNLLKWVERVGKDGTRLPKDSPTSNFTKYYLPAHQDIFGKLEPLLCKRFDFRMSLLEIPHASTLFCYQMQCLIYSWPTGIDEDHVYLDNIKSLDWEGVANCSRRLVAPTIGVSGDSPRSLPKEKFPASVMLESVSSLCDALVGLRLWMDCDVVEERDTLLGEDEGTSRA
jgi:hypothetical protein